jgi:hypothetical protein
MMAVQEKEEGGQRVQGAVEKEAGDEHAFIPDRASGWQTGGLRRHAGRSGR